MTMRLGVLSAVALALVWGCGSPSEKGAAAGTGGKIEGKLEVAAFKGGYGIDFYEAAAKEYQAAHPGLEIEVSGDPRVWEKLRPRLVAGTPPDLMYPGWGMDSWALIEEGQVLELDAALDSPAEGQAVPWRDTFEPSILKLGQKDGKQYLLPYFFNVLGWWHNPELFKKNGWTPPKTYSELLTLCEKIKAKGIAPITFQGKYPVYMVEMMLLPWAQNVGGYAAVRDAQNLVPGAWKSTAILQAARMINELKDKGYFQEGAVGLSHTESQTEFLNDKAAMIPCGTWLYSEMKSVMRPGAKMEFLPVPIADGGAGDPTAQLISIEPWMVPTAAKNPDAAIGFFKHLTSLDSAKKFVEEKGTLMAIKGSDGGQLPETLVVPSRVFKESKTVWSYMARWWYPPLHTEIENALTAMLNGDATPVEFCDRVEAAAEKVRQDASIAKHKLE